MSSAFRHFASFTLPELVARKPRSSLIEVEAHVETIWRSMSESQRRPWDNLAAFELVNLELRDASKAARGELRAEESSPMKNSRPSRTNSTARPRVKRDKTENEPRQPDTPYICFWRQERLRVIDEYPKLAGPDVSREVGLRWKALSHTERQEWNDCAARDCERYKREVAALQDTEADRDLDFETTIPVQQTITAFQFFLSHHRGSMSLLSFTPFEFVTEIRAIWGTIPAEAKQRWQRMEAADKTRRERQLLKEGTTTPRMSRLEDLKDAATAMGNGPPLPQTAFDWYARAKSRERDPDGSAVPVDDMVAVWSAMLTSEKVPFIGEEQHDIERFVRDMEDLDALHNDYGTRLPTEPDAASTNPVATSSRSSRRSRQGRRVSAANVKRPLNAFNTMCMMKRTELMAKYQLTHNECSALCGQLWSEMNDHERQRYYDVAAADKARFQRELAEQA